jgi:hypothetical protein
MQRHIQ